MPSAPAATVDEDATTTAISGNPSSRSTPHTAEHGAARTEARETAANDLPAPVLVYPSVDGTLAELGPLYRREATASDATDGTEDPAEWQVEVDGARRPLPAMREWIREALAHRPTEAAPLTAASVRNGPEPQAGPPHGARASDSNSSTSIAVTRVKRSRSFSPARSSPAVNLSAGAEAEPMDKTEHEKTSKKEKKKDAKKKKKTRRSSRRKHRRRRSSKSPTSDCEDLAPTAADTEIREEASSRHTPPEGTEAAADSKPAVQPVESALTPTSPAEGERDHSSISELEYMHCQCCLHLPGTPTPTLDRSVGPLSAETPTPLIVADMCDESNQSAQQLSRTPIPGQGGGWPPKAATGATSGTSVKARFVPGWKLACLSLFCHSRFHIPVQIQPVIHGPLCHGKDIHDYHELPCLSWECSSAPLRFKSCQAPAITPEVALLCSPMANKDHTADQAANAPTGRHPGTPIRALVADFRRHFPRPVASAEIETPAPSLETATAQGTGDQPIITLPMITVSPPDQSSPMTSTPSTVVVKNRKRSGQVPVKLHTSEPYPLIPLTRLGELPHLSPPRQRYLPAQVGR